MGLSPVDVASELRRPGGQPFLHDYGSGSVFLGIGAGNLTLPGGGEATAVGFNALHSYGGGSNTAIGYAALENNFEGGVNTAAGRNALQHNTAGSGNAAFGDSALTNNTGDFNVAVGFSAGNAATTGTNNIYLGSRVFGIAGESNAMYLGKGQTKTVIAGIRGITTGAANAIPVVIDSNGQLGTVSSSIRFKEDIHEMGDVSRRLLQLRPVTFRYTQAYRDGAKPIQYGLIAEEVAEVFPELAVQGADGQVETVHYETLNVLLLNEFQKQAQRIDEMERMLRELLATRRD